MSAEKRLVIGPADFDSPELRSLLETHTIWTTDPAYNFPGQDTYVLDLDALKKDDVQLFCCWEVTGNGSEAEAKPELVGCAALRTYRPRDYSWPADEPEALEGEVKSMHTLESHRNKGIGRLLMNRVVQAAEEHGIKTIRLETGTTSAFAGTRAFYARCGFKPCGPFAGYVVQENSAFMARTT
jgi:putative acetyltransferase